MAIDVDDLRRYEALVGDWQAFEEACRAPLPTVVWANPARGEALRSLNVADGVGTADEGPGTMLAHRLAARGYRTEPVGWYPDALKIEGLEKPGLTLEHLLGIYHVQEEISLVPAVVLAPRPGDRILDLCAAPGGKTAQMAVALGSSGTVVANDVRVDRVRALRSNCERLGLLNVAMTAQDGTNFPLDAGHFDAILLDVPCSCEGNVRQGAGYGYAAAGGTVTGRAGLQATLLGRAWKLLAPGGRLVYATCTFAPEENEVVLDYALRDDAVIEPVSVRGLEAASGVTQWQGARLRPDCVHVARFWPHLNDTGGFTLARVRKRAS